MARSSVWRSVVFVLTTVLLVVLAAWPATSADRIFWSTHGKIYRADLDGTNVEQIAMASDIGGLSLDAHSQKIFFTSSENYCYGFPEECYYTASVRRINLDGSELEVVLSVNNDQDPYEEWIFGSIALDPIEQKFYWGGTRNCGDIWCWDGYLKRANLDGTDEETVLTEFTGVYGNLTLDPGSTRVYWKYWELYTASQIERADLDGMNVETVLFHPATVFDLDKQHDRIYFAYDANDDPDILEFVIARAELFDTGPREILVELPTGVRCLALAVDPIGDRICWSGDIADYGDGMIRCSDLDGNDAWTVHETDDYHAPLDLEILNSGRTDCNHQSVTCEDPLFWCGPGEVQSVWNGCWAGCVPYDECPRILCESDSQCPTNTHCRWYATWTGSGGGNFVPAGSCAADLVPCQQTGSEDCGAFPPECPEGMVAYWDEEEGCWGDCIDPKYCE